MHGLRAQSRKPGPTFSPLRRALPNMSSGSETCGWPCSKLKTRAGRRLLRPAQPQLPKPEAKPRRKSSKRVQQLKTRNEWPSSRLKLKLDGWRQRLFVACLSPHWRRRVADESFIPENYASRVADGRGCVLRPHPRADNGTRAKRDLCGERSCQCCFGAKE